jgi:hypothetical protein
MVQARMVNEDFPRVSIDLPEVPLTLDLLEPTLITTIIFLCLWELLDGHILSCGLILTEPHDRNSSFAQEVQLGIPSGAPSPIEFQVVI